jgi:hypothetical protein
MAIGIVINGTAARYLSRSIFFVLLLSVLVGILLYHAHAK